MTLSLSTPVISDTTPVVGGAITATAQVTGGTAPYVFAYQWGTHDDLPSGGGGTKLRLFNRTLPSNVGAYESQILAAMDYWETLLEPNDVFTDTNYPSLADGVMTLSQFSLNTSSNNYASAGYFFDSVYWGENSGIYQPSRTLLNISTTLWPTLNATEQAKVMRHEFGHMLGLNSILFRDSTESSKLRQSIGNYNYTNTSGAAYFYGSPWDAVLTEYKRITGFTGATKIPHDTTGHWSVVQYQNQYPGYLNELMSSGASGRTAERTTSSQLLKYFETLGYKVIGSPEADPDINTSATLNRSGIPMCGGGFALPSLERPVLFADISGATNGTYIPTTADIGEQLEVSITVTDATGAQVSGMSAPTSAVVAAPAPPTPPTPPTPPSNPPSLGPTFPQLVPSARRFDPGNFAVKAYNAQDGAEIRFLYGDKRVGMKLQLTYENISDANAELFMDHFHDCQGTFQQFLLGTGGAGAKRGWEGDANTIGAEYWGSRWRYENPPQLQSIYPGVSTVSVNLIAATVP